MTKPTNDRLNRLRAVCIAMSLASHTACASAPPHDPVAAPPSTGSGTAVFRVMTLNVAHGARAPLPAALFRRATIERNLEDVSKLLRDVAPDVVALEEL